jgi:formylmethanofuran dehydrogenase subunit C
VLRVQGNADDWLGREIRGGKIIPSATLETILVPVTGAESAACAAGEIEIEGKARVYLGDHHVCRKN